MEIIFPFIEKGGFAGTICILVWLLLRADKQKDTLQTTLNEVQNARIGAVTEMVQAIERNTAALNALSNRLLDRR